MAESSSNAWLEDYQSVAHVGPDDHMTPKVYASFLEGRDVTVTVIVDRLREEYSLTMSEAWGLVRRSVDCHGPAHIREVGLIEGLREYRDDFTRARKVASNLGLQQPAAMNLVAAYRASLS